MYYEHNGKVYGARSIKGVPVWQRVTVKTAAGEVRIVGAGDSLKKLPPGARPVTAAEVIARYPAQGNDAGIPGTDKGGQINVSDA